MEKKESIEQNQIIFLIGAGASIPVGIPAMEGMYKSFLNRRYSDITDNEKRICNHLTKELGVEEDLEEFLLISNLLIQYRDTGLYKLVPKSKQKQKKIIRLREYHIKLNTYISEIESLRNRILSHMSRICFKFNREKSCEIFYEFIKSIVQRQYPIYTTNYDYALEYVAQENNILINDNFVKKGQRDIWSNDIKFNLQNALTLIKLHGSVTWYSNEDGIIEKIYADTYINPMGQNISKLVVFPTRFKDIYDQHFLLYILTF